MSGFLMAARSCSISTRYFAEDPCSVMASASNVMFSVLFDCGPVLGWR